MLSALVYDGIRPHLIGSTNSSSSPCISEREFFIDNLLVRIHLIIVVVRWTGLAPWEFDSPIPGSLASTFLVNQ